ncbi:aminoacyl-tRNA deacylase [Paenibacillus sp. HW567]|uniref:aminoacyl-tRNA deacylase n=1 Tax=Paenibacillus sp. HW567 TaxID=1034769 RepID=UPI00037AB05D|nr:YbaK/EbsC family protein [Paenibacillus sp. HW567]
MLTLPELAAFLDEKNSDYELIAHEAPIRSTRDAEQYFDLAKAAPTLIIQTEHGLVAFIASSQRGRVDLKALKQELGYVTLKMAEPSKVLEATGYHIGAIPLIGHGLPCLFDNRLLSLDYIYGGTGDELHTLKIAPADVIRLNRVLAFVV